MKHLLTDTAVLLRILELVHTGLVDNTVMTKRYKLSGTWAFSVLTANSYQRLVLSTP